jgi:hypothetical protein
VADSKKPVDKDVYLAADDGIVGSRDWDSAADESEARNESQSAKGDVLASEGAFPKTWKEAVPYVVWVVLVLGFGLEFVTALVHGDWLHVLVSLVGLVGLMAMALHWKQLQDWARRISPNWIVGVFALLLEALILAPFIEEHRLPFVGGSNGPAVPTTKLLWPPLTDGEESSLERALKIIPKHGPIRIVCMSANCRELAGNFISAFHAAGWQQYAAFSGFYTEPIGLTLYVKDTSDHTLADAIEKSTGLKIEHIEPSNDPSIESIFFGIRP